MRSPRSIVWRAPFRWKVEGARGQLVTGAWTRNDTTGATVETTITIRNSVRNPACRDVTMQVRTFKKP